MTGCSHLSREECVFEEELRQGALNGSVNRPWSMERVVKIKRWESKDLGTDPQTKNECRRLGGLQEEEVEGDEDQMVKGEIGRRG